MVVWSNPVGCNLSFRRQLALAVPAPASSPAFVMAMTKAEAGTRDGTTKSLLLEARKFHLRMKLYTGFTITMIGKLVSSKTKSPSTSSAYNLSSDISSAILTAVGSRGIPPMPGAAQSAFKLATDPNAEAQDFIAVIEADEALSARVVKVANSVYFDRGKPSKTVEESVLVIGLQELRCLLNATTLSELFPSRSNIRVQLWANDIATAIIARQLAQRLLPAQSEQAFLAGLMHDLGKLLLLQRLPDQYAKVLKIVEQTGEDFCSAEQQVFVFNHCEVGQLIARRWNFSDDLLAVIQQHHLSWDDSSLVCSPASLSCLIKAADQIAHAAGLGLPASFNRFKIRAEQELSIGLSKLGISSSEQPEIIKSAQRSFASEHDLYVTKH